MRPSFSSTRTGQIRTIRSAIATLWARWSAVIISRVTSMSLPIAMPSRVSSVGNSVYTFHVLLQYYTHRSLMHLFGPAVLVVRSSHNFSHNLTIVLFTEMKDRKLWSVGVHVWVDGQQIGPDWLWSMATRPVCCYDCIFGLNFANFSRNNAIRWIVGCWKKGLVSYRTNGLNIDKNKDRFRNSWQAIVLDYFDGIMDFEKTFVMSNRLGNSRPV